MESRRLTRRGSRVGAPIAACLATAALSLAGLPAGAASATRTSEPVPVTPGDLDVPAGKLQGPFTGATPGRTAVFVELAGDGAAEAAANAASGARVRVARDRRAAVARAADAVLATARSRDGRATELFQVSNAVPGIALRANSAALRAIAAREDVVKVSPLVPKRASNANTANLVRALETWRVQRNTGEGVSIGVIDTGLDYTHADFGGPGTREAYDAALADETNADWRSGLPAMGRTKVAGGYDFVGNAYDPDSEDPAVQVPKPDPDPVDCEGHGTHVAGTAAGYGVTAAGSTFAGRYDRLTARRLMDMRVGPGMAPEATLYPLKVFGCTGGTLAVIPALDWSLDPDGDGDFSDHLDVVNLSLGLDYGAVDDPENQVVNEIAEQGVLPVISMGNAGDLTDVGGSPGNAVRSIAVASSVDAYQLLDGLHVNAPEDLAGVVAGQVSVAYDWRDSAPVTGEVAAIPGPNADGCDPLNAEEAARVAGKVAWLEWDDDGTTRRCGSAGRAANVRAAGAVGALFTSELAVFAAGITGDPQIPVFQLTAVATKRLRPAVEAGTLEVTFDGELVATVKDVNPSLTDTVSTFTSRGPHGTIGVVKPDVAAPGQSIASAEAGSGDGPLSISGTSMAAPHVAGIAALVRREHPRWTTEQVKAAIMNTASHDLYTKPGREGLRYGPARVGAGRVDARRATTTGVLAYTAATRGAVSASFGVVPAPVTAGKVTRRQRVVVENTGTSQRSVSVRYGAIVRQPGVSYSVSPSSLVVPAGARRSVTVTMTVVPRALRHTIDPTMAREQLDVARQYLPDASGRLLVTVRGSRTPALRVPVYGAAKPVSQTSAAAAEGQVVISGQGVDQGAGRQRYRSLVSVLELGATSGHAPLCTVEGPRDGCVFNQSTRAADLRYVGAGSDDRWLWFGLATHAEWAAVGGRLIPVVDLDTTGDGEPDFQLFVRNVPDTDVLVAQLYSFAADAVVDAQPVNFHFGDVDTNVFDTNVLLVPVLKKAIDVPAEGSSFPLSYRAGTVWLGDGFQVLVDSTDDIAYDAGTPSVSTDGPLFTDAGGTRIDVDVRAPGKRALVLHLHGAPGERAEVLDVPAD